MEVAAVLSRSRAYAVQDICRSYPRPRNGEEGDVNSESACTFDRCSAHGVALVHEKCTDFANLFDLFAVCAASIFGLCRDRISASLFLGRRVEREEGEREEASQAQIYVAVNYIYVPVQQQ